MIFGWSEGVRDQGSSSWAAGGPNHLVFAAGEGRYAHCILTFLLRKWVPENWPVYILDFGDGHSGSGLSRYSHSMIQFTRPAFVCLANGLL